MHAIKIALMLISQLGNTAQTPSEDEKKNKLFAIESLTFEEVSYTIVRPRAQVEFFWKNDQGEHLRTFERLESWLQARGRKLHFATNGGIFEPSLDPTGLLIIDSVERQPLNLKEGRGNFYLQPNGVFYSEGTAWHIASSVEFADSKPTPRIALQSGPLLVERGSINPAFSPNAQSRYIRSGVGVRDSDAIIAISTRPVTLYEFAKMFVDVLGCKDALYLDGAISEFYVPPTADPTRREYATFLAITSPED